MGFDPAAATAAYLAQLPPAAQAKATAYTHGGEWLLLWGWLVSTVVAVLILRSGVLARISERLGARRPRPLLTAFVIGVVFSVLGWLLELPWSVYAHWWREKSYGLTSQTLGGWFGEQLVSLTLSSLLGALFFTALYALIRRSPKRWWAWGAGLAVSFLVLMMVLAPIFIEPIFNRYTPAPPGAVRDTVVALAKASGVPSDKIFVYNGSKQSNRYTANVSGLFGSARVAMSDVMFKKGADLGEVRGVVGHEMGHYAHAHNLWAAAALSLIAAALFWLTDRLFPLAQRWMGANPAAGIADPTTLPVLLTVVATLMLLATPLTRSLTRIEEADADAFSLEHARAPDGLARGLMKTVEYRAASPSRIEETLFYDHPSVSRRIRRAMDWKAAHFR